MPGFDLRQAQEDFRIIEATGRSADDSESSSENSFDGGPIADRQRPSERLVRDIRRATRNQYSAKE
jgi:hypothetical protein